ncbi:MAG: non-heme iron oxygenase ferredoxin subunit [Calditrichaeota bacterium]|nr:non-heme iron oxygenase ferredoxin subunit [Calditrichota bacterium]RQV99944.1 MAG: non-heme iron oxygenase ferredoxin subunit [Calditrichota bacterium]
MPQWIKVTAEDAFDGNVHVFEHEGWPIAVYRLEDGYFAIDDTCSHEEASLSEGEIEDGKIECPLHGAQFDIRTGKNLTLPAVLPVRNYPVKVENGDIFVKVS